MGLTIKGDKFLSTKNILSIILNQISKTDYIIRKESEKIIIDSYLIILYTGLFLAPGYIIYEIISTIMPQKTYFDKVKTVRFIGYSILNFLFRFGYISYYINI